ncbi:MAG: hypothetical protein SVU88_03645 [Candidatus Nanohaloarchaea archaeon]|nr:hypothetical protein [Candidatus Nanohaloarchaea archaeon]
MGRLDELAADILDIYARELDEDGQFHHALEELAKHPPKVSRLYEQDETDHLREEIVDVLLLAHILRIRADVDAEDIEASAERFIDKVDEIYGE